ncbi:SSI family serine proteinase inhibitor [Actinoplanes sp. NPDC049118]|uniref:SSI family serine proteinase inhibitor n=1 Tax=Actinoplanes sp. NPDC049118 TaxID=3155769 RepID=UPI0033C5AC18
MIRAVAALAVAALLLTADPAAAIGGSAGIVASRAAVAAVGGPVAAGTGSPDAAAISAAAGNKATARRNVVAGGRAAGGAAAGTPAAKEKTELTLSRMSDNGYATAVVLRCHPAGGGHPKKVKACRLLAKVDGDPSKLEPAPTMCTLEYAPVTAQIKGTWQGRRVDWSRRFGNRCEMNRTTGVLMAF